MPHAWAPATSVSSPSPTCTHRARVAAAELDRVPERRPAAGFISPSCSAWTMKANRRATSSWANGKLPFVIAPSTRPCGRQARRARARRRRAARTAVGRSAIHTSTIHAGRSGSWTPCAAEHPPKRLQPQLQVGALALLGRPAGARSCRSSTVMRPASSGRRRSSAAIVPASEPSIIGMNAHRVSSRSNETTAGGHARPPQQRHGLAGGALAAAGEAEVVGGRRPHRDPRHLGAERGRERRAHRLAVRGDARRLHDHDRVDVHELPPARRGSAPRPARSRSMLDAPAQRRVVGGEQVADVLHARGAEQRVGDRVADQVGVGVALEAALGRDLDAGEHQPAARPRTRGRRSRSRPAARPARSRRTAPRRGRGRRPT